MVYRMMEKRVAILGLGVVGLVLAVVLGQMLYYTPIFDGLNSQVDAKQDQIEAKETQISNLNFQITTLQDQIDLLQSSANSDEAQILGLQSQLADLQSQLLDATELIAQLQGPTGILPTYMDLGWVGPTLNDGNYFLQLSLKNTGSIPINQIIVTINSVQLPMTFTYLNTTVSPASPLPSYQTAIGIEDATPPVLHPETYPLVIQTIASNGTIYTYQTTITSHT